MIADRARSAAFVRLRDRRQWREFLPSMPSPVSDSAGCGIEQGLLGGVVTLRVGDGFR